MVFFLLLICIIFLVNNLSQSDENKATIEEITQLSLNRVPLSNFLKSMSYVVAFVYYSKGLFSLAITITITCLIELLIYYIVNRLSKLLVDDVLQNEGL
jgi:hypothetical protein